MDMHHNSRLGAGMVPPQRPGVAERDCHRTEEPQYGCRCLAEAPNPSGFPSHIWRAAAISAACTVAHTSSPSRPRAVAAVVMAAEASAFM
jgi:hypothetical protein